MAISIPKKKGSLELVFYKDPDVEQVEDGFVGWVPTDRAQYTDAADVVVVGPLGADDKALVGDRDGFQTKMLNAVRKGLRSINGDKTGAKRKAFIDGLDSGVLAMLGLVILALTNGKDPNEIQIPVVDAIDENDVEDETEVD